jgi:hypothetical protein
VSRIPFALALVVVTPLSAAEPRQVPDSLREVASSQALLDSHEPLELVIEAPLTSIFRERGQDPEEFPGRVIHVAADGTRDTLADVELRTRGITRLRRDVCEFPPIRLDFDREEVTGTIFEGQNRLKLAVHCQNDDEDYEQYVLKEYLAYRMHNLLTDLSFRVRLARVTYVDTDEPDETLTRRAFLIEDDELMAARNGMVPLVVPNVSLALTDPAYLALTEIFEYLVGNPDWSAIARGPAEEECCHNTTPIVNEAGFAYSVPYDFDITGIVDARYANRVFNPSERGLGIRSIRQRVYRGICPSLPHLEATLQLFVERRDALYALYQGQEGLDPDVLEDTIEYLDEFFETISDPGRVDSEIRRACRG